MKARTFPSSCGPPWIAKGTVRDDLIMHIDMAAYLGKGNPVVEKNIAQTKRWAKEGK